MPGGSPYLKRMDIRNYQAISLALLKFFVQGADSLKSRQKVLSWEPIGHTDCKNRSKVQSVY